MEQGYEIDFLPVGNGEKSGDAIALRFGNLYGSREEQKVIIIDGGYTETGEILVDHIKKHYHTDDVDLVVSTHSDADHSAGLSVVLDKLVVKKLWMHKPWEHTDDMAKMFISGRVTDASVQETLRKSLDNVKELEAIAGRKSITIEQPFTGVNEFGGQLFVLGPSVDFYRDLLPSFRVLPEAKKDLGVFGQLLQKGKDAVQIIAERLDHETLNDEGETSAENETSTILLLSVCGKNILFTADAGQRALNGAITFLERNNFDLSSLAFIQVPHHGSQRNIGPAILNKLVGPIQQSDAALKIAFVSCAPDGDPKHPSKKVANAFRRRGAPIHATQGTSKWQYHNAPDRENYNPSVALPFYHEVEE